MLREAMDEEKRRTSPSVAEMDIDIFQCHSLMFPIIKWDDVGVSR